MWNTKEVKLSNLIKNLFRGIIAACIWENGALFLSVSINYHNLEQINISRAQVLSFQDTEN